MMIRFRIRPASLAAIFVLAANLPCRAQLLELSVEPEVGAVGETFTFVLTNRGAEPFPFTDCCPVPMIASVANGKEVPTCIDYDCGGCQQPVSHQLPPGRSLSDEWYSCTVPPPAPGIYEVRWKGFPESVRGRYELVPDPKRTLPMSADPPETRIGELVRIGVVNDSASDLISVNCECDLSPSVLDPVGRNALCLPCPQCVRAEELPAGKALEFGWTPGPDHCGEEMLPGRYRVTWGGFSNEGETHFGETGVLVLPPLDRRLELSPSQNDVRPGDLLEITVTNPLAVPVWYRGCCDEVIFIDVLGRESLAYPCGDDCMVSRRQEIPPGASLRLEVSVPGSAPGRLSVLWGRSLGLEPGSKPTPPVFGYAEVTVLPDAAPPFRRGDCDGAGGLDVTDAVRLLEYLFLGGAAPKCPDACDADDSGELELTDAVWTLAFLFLGGPNPLPPFPAPGPDPTPDLLGCKG